jgi:MIP family channel proteins
MQTRVHSLRRGESSSKKIDLSLSSINNFARRLAGEAIGTFFLTWMHAGLALSIANTEKMLTTSPQTAAKGDSRTNPAAAGLGAGFSLAGLVYALGHISGAHFNPGVSLAFVCRGDMNPLLWFPYVAMQLAGAIGAGAVLLAVFNSGPEYGSLGANHPTDGFNVVAAFWMEFIATVFLHLAIIGTATRGTNIGGHAALASGLTIGSLVAFLTPYGGGSMNPARSIGPAIFAADPGVRQYLWIYVTAPLASGIITGTLLRWLAPPNRGSKKGEEEQLATGTLENDNKDQQA